MKLLALHRAWITFLFLFATMSFSFIGTTRNAVGQTLRYLEQGLNPKDRQLLHYSPQGSEIMPYAWFLALEQPWNDKLFRDPEFMESLRFAPNPSSELNPDGLPVGFVRGKGTGGKDWFGLTCAACHTTDLTFQGRRLRVDGGTTLADMIRFQQTLIDSVRVTLSVPDKFSRFANRVFGKNYNEERANELRTELEQQLGEMDALAATSRPYRRTGHGVWDAVNILMNTVNATAINEPGNFRSPHVPVSFPSIWQSNHYDRLLWNASVHNVALRQVGEVIIVFGKARVVPHEKGLKFESSADFRGLEHLYELVSQINPPQWPADVLGQLDEAKVAQGAKIYEREGCAKCHANKAPYPMTPPNRYGKSFIRIQQVPLKEVGTDPAYAEYFVRRTAMPGIMAPAFKGTSLANKHEIPAALLFLAILTEITHAEVQSLNVPASEYPRWLGYRDLPELPQTDEQLAELVNQLLSYRAAPLAGTWATAPYLHNGSVPSLYELLLPPDQRSKTFYLGNREFDAKKVGYDISRFQGGYLYDTSHVGQSNQGHLYGTTLSEDERWALVEYLKSM